MNSLTVPELQTRDIGIQVALLALSLVSFAVSGRRLYLEHKDKDSRTTRLRLSVFAILVSGVVIILMGNAIFTKYNLYHLQNQQSARKDQLIARLDKDIQKHRPREITPEMRQHFLAAVRDLPKGALAITSAQPTKETADFIHSFHLLLVQADFPKVALGIRMGLNPPLKQPWLIHVYTGTNSSLSLAETIGRGLSAMGITPYGTMEKSIKSDSIEIYIGNR